jgi:hypothetical protein
LYRAMLPLSQFHAISRAARSREASPAAHVGGGKAQQPAGPAAQPADSKDDAAGNATERTASDEADSFLAEAELPDGDQVSTGMRCKASLA